MTTTPQTTIEAVQSPPARRRRSGRAALAGVARSGLVLAGCANAGEGAISGAGLGALAGLIIGSTSGNPGEGAAIGAAIGGVGGAVIGDQNERAERQSRHVPRHDHYDRGRYHDDW